VRQPRRARSEPCAAGSHLSPTRRSRGCQGGGHQALAAARVITPARIAGRVIAAHEPAAHGCAIATDRAARPAPVDACHTPGAGCARIRAACEPSVDARRIRGAGAPGVLSTRRGASHHTRPQTCGCVRGPALGKAVAGAASCSDGRTARGGERIPRQASVQRTKETTADYYTDPKNARGWLSPATSDQQPATSSQPPTELRTGR
jgi:hypothetical protein